MMMDTTPAYLSRLFALVFLSVALGAMNSVLSSAYLPDIVASFGGGTDEAESGRLGAWINFCFLAGATAGGILFGFLSDRIGRRSVLLMALLCYGAGSAAGAVVPAWKALAATRFFVGIGVGTVLVISAVLLSEAWPSRTKAVALGILSVAYPAGIVASGLITSNIADWRVAFFVGAAALMLAIPVHFGIRETAVLQRQASASPQLAVPDGYRTELASGVLIYGTMLIGIWAAFSWLPTWVQSLEQTEPEAGQSQRGLSLMLLGAGGLAGGIVSGFLANRFGSRQVQAACFTAAFLLSYGLFQMTAQYSGRVSIGIALLGICFGISQGVLNTYIPGLFPVSLRSTATGLCFHVGRAFTAAAVFFVGAFVVWFGGYGHAIFAFSFVYVAGLAALLFIKH